ncbi:hypothetical protein GCM10009613_24660 [Pseudonocardia kongjuensis]|uniref:Uncharacterized protein n=1 Tax=Pseudonocardia kongjuensis TaxID=102227 RepID=A0ABP4II14_9PSEU
MTQTMPEIGAPSSAPSAPSVEVTVVPVSTAMNAASAIEARTRRVPGAPATRADSVVMHVKLLNGVVKFNAVQVVRC